MRLPVISDAIEYDVCGVGQYAASNRAPSPANPSSVGVVGRV